MTRHGFRHLGSDELPLEDQSHASVQLLTRRRDPRPDPNLKLDADRRKLAAVERLRAYPMSFTAAELNQDPDGAREHADEIQRRLDAALTLCRWAAEALPADDRHTFLSRAEDEHKKPSTWLSITPE